MFKKFIRSIRSILFKKKTVRKKRKHSRRLPVKKKKAPLKARTKKLTRPRPKRKSLKKKVRAKTSGKAGGQALSKAPDPKLAEVGEITHYFSKIQVVVLKISKSTLAVGDVIHVKGKTTDFSQKVQSLQVESVDVKLGEKGSLVGLKVVKPARENDKVFKVVQ